MRQTIRLGTVAGIRIGLNGGAIIILLLLAGGLALGGLPAQEPGRPLVLYLLGGLVAAALFLASVLAHEVAHALVARRNGVEVESITLWLLGGVAQLKGDPRTPGAEFRIAAVGPLASVVIGIVFGVLAVGIDLLGVDSLAVSLTWYLALSNIVLALFNLVPASPLDGGRVLRAVVWRVTGDRVKSAVVASRIGRIFGLTLIIVGLGQVVLRGWLGGLWWALIGWFLVQAATAEEHRAVLGRRLHGVRVSELMTPDPVTASPDENVADFVERSVLRHRFSTYPLVDADGRLAGLVTLNRIRAVPAEARATRRLGDVACPADQVPSTRMDEPVVELLPRLAGCADGRAVVVDAGGRVIGVVSPSDLSRLMAVAGV
jgi:Zn-dependent protease